MRLVVKISHMIYNYSSGADDRGSVLGQRKVGRRGEAEHGCFVEASPLVFHFLMECHRDTDAIHAESRQLSLIRSLCNPSFKKANYDFLRLHSSVMLTSLGIHCL